MTRNQGDREGLLLEYHLHRLDDERRLWLEAELRRNADLRALNDRVGQLLRPLDYWVVPTIPARLAERVLSRVELAGESQPPVVAPSPPGEVVRSFRLGSWRDVLAVAACLALLVTLSFPVLSAVRSRSQRVRCAANLGSIFQGTRLYQAAFGGTLPYAGGVAGAAWLPGCEADVPFQSNSRHIFLVAKLNYGPGPEDFICPGDPDAQPMALDKLASHQDFAATRNISYANLNMSARFANSAPRHPIAYVSDPNPLFIGGRFDATVDPVRANSRAHGGRDQAILILDGTVTRMSSPIMSGSGDNVWLAGNILRYEGNETPASENDSFLVQGYPDTDPQVRKQLQRFRSHRLR